MIFNDIFRPWGDIKWVDERITVNSKWDFLGCLSTEDRCVAAYNFLNKNQKIGQARFFNVIDPKETSNHNECKRKNKSILDSGGQEYQLEEHKLLEPLSLISRSVMAFLQGSNGNIIIDISSFPKRFFFPIVKFILKHLETKNLIITYTRPKKYSENSLSSNPQPWMNIPSFKEDEGNIDAAIVGVGFMPLGLPDFLGSEGQQNMELNLLFPFPPGPPAYQRTWNFVKELNDYRNIQGRELVRIDAIGLPEIFDRICAISNGKKSLFAPFGPKPISLAMCLYASQTNSPVYYTQPTIYDPLYSEGYTDILAYCIKLNGKNLYAVKKEEDVLPD